MDTEIDAVKEELPKKMRGRPEYGDSGKTADTDGIGAD